VLDESLAIAVEVDAPRLRHARHLGEQLGHDVGLQHHQRVQRGEGLQLDDLALQAAVRSAGDGEVDLHAARQGVHARHVQVRRDGALHLLDERRIGDGGDDLARRGGQPLAQLRGQEERSLRHAERDLAAQPLLEPGQVPRIEALVVRGVEPAPQLRIHGRHA
jgi:hypothetical protein